jgi:hypothetical protein
MRPRYWLLTTLSIILIATAAIAGLNMAVDIYGLYRPSRGRRLPILGDDRVAKYLLSMRYVPENFNAVIVGASISANWDITAIERLRVYNGSLDGGNIVEEKALIEAALQRPGVSVILLLVNPALTYSHEFETVELKPELERSALGSLSLWNAYRNMLSIRIGRTPQPFDYAGTETFLNARSEMNVNMKKMWSEPEFTVDPVALQAHRDLVANLRARGVQLVFIVPPTSEHLLETKRAPLERYLDRMRSEIGTGSLWIDFLAPEGEAFCKTRANFSDGVHLTPDGAKQVVAQINAAVNRWITEGRLVVAKR